MRPNKPEVGFGESSRSRTTSTMNAFMRVETRPVTGGADVTVHARRGLIVMPEVDQDSGEVTIRIRRDCGPRIGERVMLGKRLVEVAERRWTSNGRLQIRDADTGAWLEVTQ